MMYGRRAQKANGTRIMIKKNPILETSLEREWRKMLFVWVKISATEFYDKAEPFKIDHDQ